MKTVKDMSLLDYFAGQALSSELGNVYEYDKNAKKAYQQAEAMLKEREIVMAKRAGIYKESPTKN